MPGESSDRWLQGEVVLVTGSTSGLGKQIARTCAARGARVVVTGRDETRGRLVVDDIAGAGGSAEFVGADLVSEEGPARLVEEISSRIGPLTALVNNAVSHEAIDRDGSVLDVERATFVHALTVDLVAPAMLCKAVIPGMLEVGKGAIVNITATSAHVGVQGQASYAAAKGGLDALTRQICADFGRKGIRANTIEPGYIIHEHRDAGMTDERRATLMARRLSRLATATDVAETVAFFLSRHAEVIVGVTLTIDGGATAVRPSVL
jgi:NAD(P)-dependent dehydrogenase (short-subunit alcohol dehydrogenase family)